MGAAMIRFATFAVLSSVLAWVPLALAQENSQQQQQGQPQAAIRISVDFAGGTVAEYVTALRKAQAKQPVNIVVTPEAEDLPVPPAKLIEVPIEAAVHMLEGDYPAPEGGFARINVDAFSRLGEARHTLLKVSASVNFRNLHTSVWSVAEDLAAGLSAEEMLAAVEAVLSVFPNESNLKFHEATGLLILRGTEEQIAVVEEALERLHDGIAWRENQQEILHDRMAPLKSELQKTEIELRVARQELNVMQLRLNRAMKNHEEGILSEEEVAHEELEVTRADGRVQILQHQMQDLIEQIERLDNKLKNQLAGEH